MLPTFASPLQQHNALLAEYDAVLERLHDAQVTGESPYGYFHAPITGSPLQLALGDALHILRRVLSNPRYVTALRERGLASDFLEVTFVAEEATYITYYLDGSGVVLDLAEFPTLEGLLAPVATACRDLGGGLRSDALLPLRAVLKYYAVPPALFTDDGTLDALIRQLEEMRAIEHLRLGCVADVATLIRPDQHARVLDAVSEMLADGQSSAIDCLALHALPGKTVEQVRASPMHSLDCLLNGNKAQALAARLIQSLDWYGAHPDESAMPELAPHLVAYALRLWYCDSFDERPGDLVGFRLNSPEHWGKSYQALRRAFEKHLSSSGVIAEAASDTLEAVILGHLLLSAFSSDFSVPDIPADLPYAGSIVWVNFAHGVNLAEALQPGLLQQLSFQQLVDLPLRQSENASDELLQLIALTRIEPAQRWAVATGHLESIPISEALSTLDNSARELNRAISQLNAQPPLRLALAQTEIDRVFFPNRMPARLKLIKAEPERSKRSLIDIPDLKPSVFDFAEIYAGGGFSRGQKWLASLDGKSRSKHWVRLSADNLIQTDEAWSAFQAHGLPAIHGRFLPDIESLFNQRFERYVQDSRDAYQYLIKTLLVSLPWDERQALEQEEVRIHTLKQETNELFAFKSAAEITPQRHARTGFLLEAKPLQGESRFYECLPRAGVIRRRADISVEHLGPQSETREISVTIFDVKETLTAEGNKNLPLDWQAYAEGAVPREGATCQAIIVQLGAALPRPPAPALFRGLTPLSPRTRQIAARVATDCFYYDLNDLRSAAWGETAYDRDRAEPHWLYSLKAFVPFWGSIEDLKSDDFGTRLLGVLGLFIDVVSFVVPLGKFAGGSIRLLATAGQIGIRSTLPSFSKVSGKFIKATLENLNPLAIVAAGVKLSRDALLLAGRSLYRAGRSSLTGIRTLTGATAHYDLVKGLTQITDPGRWKPLAQGDDLATFKGIDDVPVRQVISRNGSRHCLLDPLSLKPYGPRLLMGSSELSPGRSTFNSAGDADGHALVEIPQKAQIRELLEADGRTTLLIDDVAYRLDGRVLRRADLIGDGQRFKSVPCRNRRAPDTGLCQTRYVTRDPAPAPPPGSFDASKGWATWFGDSIYTPAVGQAPLPITEIARYPELSGAMDFQKGIYGRIHVSLPRAGTAQSDTFQVGATIVESVDTSKRYVFMRLNAGDFYVAELANGQSLREPLRFRQAITLPEALREELITVYTGSLNANNVARIYGTAAVERAMKAMDEIAIPIGGHANPPETLRLIKVDTSPGEAVLFDHSTRMIVRHSSDGAATWSLSRTASDQIRQTTARVFNALFEKTVITVDATADGAKALKIDNTMMQLQRLIRSRTGKKLHDPRNIAFAEISTHSGSREVYVSVSGQQRDTAFLPLFARNEQSAQVILGDTTYINIDHDSRFTATSLSISDSGKIRAIPHTIDNIETYSPALSARPTSLDTESKLIRVIRSKYPDPKELASITIATTMAPCDSCSVVMKQFGYDGSPEAMNVIWK